MNTPSASDGIPTRIGIVGSGLMGRGIAQIAAQAGLTVHLFDKQPGAAAEARSAIAGTLSRLADKGKLAPAARDAAVSQLQVAETLASLTG